MSATSTAVLVERARQGDAAASDALFSRYLRPLERWASGRLPRWARSANAMDTQDLVQETLVRAFTRLDGFEVRGSGSLLAYLRQVLMNRVRDEIRRAQVRPVPVEVAEDHADPTPSPLDEAIGADLMDRYETALTTLRPSDQAAIVARVELGQSYEELAVTLDKPSANAARVATARALVRLAAAMKDI